jgi:SAM-dependent methyltransferase
MNFYKDSEIAKIYGVGVATVNAWKKKAVEKKNNIETAEVEGKIKIINSQRNRDEFERLANEGRIHRRNPENIKKVDLDKSLANIFSVEEISEIYNDLFFQKTIKFKFSYKDSGAKAWDEYYLSGVSQHVKINDDFLQSSYADFIHKLPRSKKVNIFDLGPGNAYPVKDLIQYLLQKGIMVANYYCVDISQEINEIATKNIKKWFPALGVNSFVKDLDSDRLDSVLMSNTASNEVNLILFLGHTLPNHSDRQSVLKNLRSGMGESDILCFSYTNGNSKNKGSFKYVNNDNADFRHTWVAKLVGVDIEKCERINSYDEQKEARFKYLILDKDYEINFNIYGHTKTVYLRKLDKISIWQHYLTDTKNLMDDLDKTYFGLLALKQDETLCHGFVIAKGV